MVIDFYNRNGGGGGTADYATSAGTSNSTKLLEGETNFPQSGNTGDVVAIGSTPTRGTKAPILPSTGIYQYDGTNWNKIEGESSSAYKIELTEVNPQNYTQQDIDTINAFCAAFTADTSIADSAYISALNGIYRCVRYSVTPQLSTFAFEGTYNDNIVDIWLHFANNSYSYGSLQNAVPTPDFSILKSVGTEPRDLENGDVFAIHTPSADTQYEVSAWTETGEYTINFDHPVQAIKVHIKTSGHFDFGFNNPDWHDGFGFDIVADGNYGYVFSATGYDSSRWEVSEQSVKFIAPEWMAKTDGKTLYLDIREDNGDYYLYIYTEDVSKIWITDVAQNTIDGEIQEGTVIPAHGDIDKVFQANIKLEPNVKIELEGNARVDGTLDDPEQVITMSDGQMKISFYDNSNVQGVICDLESYGAYFHLYYDVSTDGWTLFDSDGENTLIKITDGESANADFGDGGVYLSYSDGVLTAYTDYEKGWKNWDMGDTHEVVLTNELAKVEDLPAENRLLPLEPSNADMTIYDSGSWRLTQRRSVVLDGLRDFQDGWQDDGGEYAITRNGYWGVNWKKIEQNKLEAIEELPVQGEDGAVYALSSSGYGIYQAQSAHTGYNWFNYNGKSVPSGFTQIRVPYNDTAESNLVHFKTDPNGEGDCNIYWHPEDSSNRRWDGLPNDPAQNDGEFSTTDAWGNTMVGTKVGDYIVVTFGAAVVDGGDPNDPMRADNHTEIYTTGSITDYANAVMSKDIARMVKCTQAEYDALVSGGTVDNNTFYVIISPNV